MESLDDGVRVLTIDRPPVNALGRELVDDLTRAAAQIASDDEARCERTSARAPTSMNAGRCRSTRSRAS
jgi:enoyl-CoA hydratase/carnithine racemase